MMRYLQWAKARKAVYVCSSKKAPKAKKLNRDEAGKSCTKILASAENKVLSAAASRYGDFVNLQVILKQSDGKIDQSV
jgi:hypothetical protein